MILFKEVCKTYANRVKVLDNLNLHICASKITVLIGPSGCGKTTTMKMINRLIDPTSGEIYLNDTLISKLNPVELRRSIGYVIQQVGLLPNMTIAENVGLVPRLLKWKLPRIKERVDELLQMVGLAPEQYRDRYPHELSGGQQQRVGVARALAADPPVILMDEPFASLDPMVREQLQDELVELQNQVQKTVVFVTHDMDEAIKLGDQIVVMREGRVLQIGSPEEILRHPQEGFVREFIGDRWFLRQPGLLKVEDIMLAEPVTVYPERGLAQSIQLMKKHKVDRLLVVNRQHQLLGIVGFGDVQTQGLDETKRLGDVMQPVKHTIQYGSPASEAINLMSDNTIPFLPVIDETDRLKGLITRGSLVKAFAEML
ncbi:MAG: ABC transporter ATP-binding protein [Bacillota bacterium]|jgi:osmoprotectant transport system ATP-binding protein